MSLKIKMSKIKESEDTSVIHVNGENGNVDIYGINCVAINSDGSEDYLDDMAAAKIYYDEDEAIQGAKELADSYKDDERVVQVFVTAGEYEKPNGDIGGEPFDVFVASSSDAATTAEYRKLAGYTGKAEMDYYAKGSNESKKSEASKFGTGMAKRKDFSKTRNLGEIMDVLEKHRKILKEKSEDMNKSKEDLEASIALLQKFEAAADFLKTQSVKGIKKALALKNSPEVKQAGEVDKALKDALSVIATDLGNIPDVTQLMVVLDSRYATRGSKILTTLEGQVSQAIEVDMATLKKSVEKGEITEDDIMQQVALTSTTHGVKDKDMVTKVTPILERMNAMLDASDKIEEAVIDPKQFAELRDTVQKLVDEASAPKDTIRTTITALDKNTIGSVQKKEAFIGEGVLDTLKNFAKSVKDKIAGLWDSFTSLFFSLEDDALEAAEVFDNIELGFALVGISITESRKAETLGSRFEVLTKSVLHACDDLVKDPSLAGDFDDELIYAEDAVKNAVESFQVLGQACESLKRALSYHKNEDNMAIIGILSDAISQIVADGEGDASSDAGAEAEEDEESVIDHVERDYAPSPEEEPAVEPEGGEAPGEEEPEQF